MPAIDYDTARALLETEFVRADERFQVKEAPAIGFNAEQSITTVFESKTATYRQVLLGCAVVKILNPEINMRLPYVDQGDNAYSGRNLYESAVDPFLTEHRIPAIRNPFLSSVRRGVQFVPETRGQKDAVAYAAFLDVITYLEEADEEDARECLRYLLYAFLILREASEIPLSDVNRLSVQQYDSLVRELLAVPSGGLMPVLIAVAIFQTISDCYELNWQIDWQGINVADAARGVGGDITVTRNNDALFTVEVTEREIDRNRVTAAFNGKIAPNGIDDYLFFFTQTEPTTEARETARQYFAQGHEINFVTVVDWAMTSLTTIGPRCRRLFTEHIRGLLAADNIPAKLKVAWNENIQAVIDI